MEAPPTWPQLPDSPENEIGFSAADLVYTPEDAEDIARWLLDCIRTHNKQAGTIEIIFCSDEYLLQLNRTWLDHDTLTDIITFPLDEDSVSGDIYISLDRVRENAQELGITFRDERDRVMIHGVLHLLGYDDHHEADKRDMRRLEDEALVRREW